MEIVAAAGYQGVELTHELNHRSLESGRRLMAKMASLGLVFDSIAGLKLRLADPAGTDLSISQVADRIEIAKTLECGQIILTSGNLMDGLSREIQHAACIENLKHLADLASKHNMQLVMEPIDLLERKVGYLNSVTEGFEIVRAVGSQNLKVLYDFYHEQRATGNLIEKLEQNISWVGLVHIADVPGRHEPGTGEINYPNIYRKLGELHYNGFVTMEYSPTIDPLESLRTSRSVAQQTATSGISPYK